MLEELKRKQRLNLLEAWCVDSFFFVAEKEESCKNHFTGTSGKKFQFSWKLLWCWCCISEDRTPSSNMHDEVLIWYVCITWSKLAEIVAICIRLDNIQARNFFKIEIKKVSISLFHLEREREMWVCLVINFEISLSSLEDFFFAFWNFFSFFSLLQTAQLPCGMNEFQIYQKIFSISTIKFVRIHFLCVREEKLW